MERVKDLFKSKPVYEPVGNDTDEEDRDSVVGSSTEDEAPFSWIEYSIFLLLGVAMLWAW